MKEKTKTEPTPGPWYVGPDAAEDCPPHKNSGLALVDTGRSMDWPIARLCEWNNARLIAAAPDLLAALKVYYGFALKGMKKVTDMEWDEAFSAASAAIAKAEGRES